MGKNDDMEKMFFRLPKIKRTAIIFLMEALIDNNNKVLTKKESEMIINVIYGVLALSNKCRTLYGELGYDELYLLSKAMTDYRNSKITNSEFIIFLNTIQSMVSNMLIIDQIINCYE